MNEKWHVVDEDRLQQRDFIKYETARKKYFGDDGLLVAFPKSNRDIIENFLSDILGEKIILKSLEKFKHHGNGYTFYKFHYISWKR
jgi:hypothetical protein